MLFCQQVETVTHVIELLNFVQDRIRMHGVGTFVQCSMPPTTRSSGPGQRN